MKLWRDPVGIILAACALEACAVISIATGDADGARSSPDFVAEAQEQPNLHERLLVMDSHLDTPIHFARDDYDFSATQSFEDTRSQVDLGRMEAGGLDGGFFVIYTGQGPLTDEAYRAARDSAIVRAFQIREVAAKHHEDVELAFRADDAARIEGTGKRAMYQSIENSYPLGEDVTLLETFYKFGVRMVGPVHFANNQFADSSTDSEGQLWGGLSTLGEELVREANRLGVVLDGSHAHDDAVEDMIELSETPIILSHTGVNAIYTHPRNISDDLLRKLAESGGVIQINAFGGYLEELVDSPERAAALEELTESVGGDPAILEGEAREAYIAARRRIDQAFPAPRSTFEKYVEHLLHALEVVGPDHVGIGADWDGGGGVDGMNDVGDLPKITEVLVEAGYSESDIEKIWSGNMLRLLRIAEEAATAEVASLPTPN